jgi:hypothetical protein
LKNTELVYYCIAKPISGTTIFNFGGWTETYTQLTNNSPYRDLGNGWRLYYKVFTAGSAINSGSTFGLNSVGGTWRFHSFGVAKGNTPPADWDASPKEIDYLKTAMQGSTDITGGLLATNVVLMKTLAGLITGGMSGLANDNIGVWTGGTYQQAINSLAKVILRKDGSGQLAGGKIFWDLLGALNVGNFNILNGNIIGKGSDGSERIRLSTEDIPAISALTSSYTYIATDVQSDGLAMLEVLFDTEINQYYIQIESGSLSSTTTVNVAIPYATNLVVEAGVLDFDIEGSAVDVTGMSQSVVVKIMSGTTIASGAVGSTLTIPSAGNYNVTISTEIGVSYNGEEQAATVIFSTSNNIKYSENVKKTAIGLDGLYSYFSDLEYLYFKSGVGLKYKGAMDIPGVLASATVSSSGSSANSSGAKVGSSSKTGTGAYTITHSVGHSNYTVIANANQADRHVIYVTKSNTQVTIQVRNGGGTLTDQQFDYMIIGNN